MSPKEWAETAIKLFHKWSADRIVAEKNQGGDLVETNIRIFSPNVPVRLVHASKGKFARAEPVAALYEKGRIFHGDIFEELENQMTTWTIDAPFSPDRMDAAVWGLTDLFLQDAGELIVF
jgi:phage terminase large subunit-like protein